MILTLAMEQEPMDLQFRLRQLLLSDPQRMDILRTVEQTFNSAAWIGGGFVRNMVWDDLAKKKTALNDIDVIYFGTGSRDLELQYEGILRSRSPHVNWSVKDQVRMARKHGHKPYGSITEALERWVEKCTAVAVQIEKGEIHIEAPWGLEELFSGIISVTDPSLMPILKMRLKEKEWLVQYPFLVVES